MRVDFVISLYQEDCRVLDQLRVFFDEMSHTKYKFSIFLYHKSDLTPQNANRTMRFIRSEIMINRLENIGRESDTYLNHMMRMCAEKRDDGYSVFIQGNPFDHSPDLFGAVRRFLESSSDMACQKGIFAPIGCDFYCDMTGRPNHSKLPIKSVFEKLGLAHPEGMMDILHFTAGAQFLVSNHLILKNGFDYYNNALNVLYDNKIPDVNPINGFVFERLWGLILTKNGRK